MPSPCFRLNLFLPFAWLALLPVLSNANARGQTPNPPVQQAAPSAVPEPARGSAPDPDAGIVEGMRIATRTPAQLADAAWTILTEAAANGRPETRVQGMAALGLLDSNPRSQNLLEAGMRDADVDVRTAAVLAAGQTKAPAITTAMRRLLNDKEPQVAFAASLALWKMGDRSGEDILMAVVDGERRASATLLNGTEHQISRDLHSPATLAKIGVLEASGMLLGPFGFGITAFEYIRKNGGDTARVNAIEAISIEQTEPVRKELVGALSDKDPGVRAAAAKALDSYHDPAISAAIGRLLDDSKAPVRYTGAAAYLISTSRSSASPKPVMTTRKPRSQKTH